jgi:DNA-directed RNA polymerase specialized sigma24 family protein
MQLLISDERLAHSSRETLLCEHFAGVFLFCLARSRNLHDAEDLSQEVFVKALGSLWMLRDDKKIRVTCSSSGP